MHNYNYDAFLKTSLAAHWKKIGLRRRAGVALPLFSIYSKQSVGVGEIPDLLLLGDWCRKTGQSLIQLLPMNDVGYNFRPYDAESSFALEPMHLCLEQLRGIDLKKHASAVDALRKKYSRKGLWFDIRIKRDKRALLYEIFQRLGARDKKLLESFSETQRFWLKDYALYRVLKDQTEGQAWEFWPEPFRDRDEKALAELERKQATNIQFEKWLQWQLYLQFKDTHEALNRKGIFILGDIPFLVSRDSADVWSRRQDFKLDRSSGAPPDLYFSGGQEWGMPAYDWASLERESFEYFTQKLKYAENFYDLYRIDHFIGLFRLWTFPLHSPAGEKKGSFDPPDEQTWETQGRKVMGSFLRATRMLPCAEDLGMVPACATKVLAEEAVPGMDIQRWTRAWETTGEFTAPDKYRPNAIATLSTHDMNMFGAWWEFETKPEERQRFWKYLGLPGRPAAHASAVLLEEALKAVNRSASIFSVQQFQDWLSLGHVFGKADPEIRINIPGVVDQRNWTLRAPVALDDWMKFPFNDKILKINQEAGRAG